MYGLAFGFLGFRVWAVLGLGLQCLEYAGFSVLGLGLRLLGLGLMGLKF